MSEQLYIVKKRDTHRAYKGDRLVYRVYYGREIVYVGKTSQSLSMRMKHHVFGRKYDTKIDVNQITMIDYCICKTVADQMLYEIYWINKLHPRLNKRHKAKDIPTFDLPSLVWIKYTPRLLPKWREELANQK